MKKFFKKITDNKDPISDMLITILTWTIGLIGLAKIIEAICDIIGIS